MADDTTTVLTPDFADASTTTTVPDGTVYPCAGAGRRTQVQTRHVLDLLSAGWSMPKGQEPPEAPVVEQASGVVPDPDAPPPMNPALETPADVP